MLDMAADAKGANPERSQEGDVPSQHEQPRNSTQGPHVEGSNGEDRPARGERSEWSEDVPSDQSRNRQGGDLEHVEGGEFGGSEDDTAEVLDAEPIDEEVERLLPTILAKIEQHLHLPIQPPDPDALAELKRKDPAAHKMWLKQVGREMDHQRFMREAKYRMPLLVILGSQVTALIALLAILGLAAYALYLDRPWVAGILTAMDVAAILTVFVGRRDSGED